ncbi:MAG: hypothetical protein JW857_00100 [Bacteroidales bacterium]|nr:hypothetical protein [Bacteroidales bacterium]
MKTKHLFLVVMLCISNLIFAQNNFILHNFDAIPQNYMTNPAIENPSRFVIGFPALSSFQTGFTSSIDFSSVFAGNSPFSPSFDLTLSDLASVMGDNNRININVLEEILYCGFQIPKGFVSFGISGQMESGFRLDKEIFELINVGNDEAYFMNKTLDLSAMDFDITAYMQYHLGFSYNASEKLTLGTRFKYLVGLGNVNFERFNADITMQGDVNSDFSSIINADILMNTSFYGAQTLLDSINMDDFDPSALLFKSKNHGIAFDFGAQYNLNDRIKLSASLIDLGFINWKTDVANYTYTLNHVDIGRFDGYENEADRFQEVIDTLGSKYNFAETKNGFRTTLSAKYYLSGSYKLDTKSWVDLLFWGRSRYGTMQTAVSVGINRQFGNIFGLKANYSIIQNSFANLGLGLSLKLGIFQLYALSDNVLPYIDPVHNHRMTNVRFGINFNIWKKDNKIAVAEPEIPAVDVLQ